MSAMIPHLEQSAMQLTLHLEVTLAQLVVLESKSLTSTKLVVISKVRMNFAGLARSIVCKCSRPAIGGRRAKSD